MSLPEEDTALVASALTAVLSNEERKRERVLLHSQVSSRLVALSWTYSSPQRYPKKPRHWTRVQALLHDPITPLAKFLKNFHSITPETAYEALKDTIFLLGNALGYISQLRRRKILKAINPELVDLPGENHFSSSAPKLFGSGFEKVMMERAESVKLLEAVKPGPSLSKRLFQEAAQLYPREAAASSQRKTVAKAGDKLPMAKK